MQALHGLKRVVQLIFDGEIYSLAWIATRNGLKRPRSPATITPSLVQSQNAQANSKKAKAVNGK